MKTLIYGGIIVNEDRSHYGSLVMENDVIAEIIEGKEIPCGNYDRKIDATGLFVLPGVIDSHVHFREPGLTAKADVGTESEAAAYGGVTTFFDMPNTVPQTTSVDALDAKFRIAREKSHVNYSFFFGATNSNADALQTLDRHVVPGVKLFMGASTGNMLVDSDDSLHKIFSNATMPVMVHCEDTGMINANMTEAKSRYGDDPDVALHPLIRSEEACYASSSRAVRMARTYGTRLHVAHVSTAKELELFGHDGNITAEAVIAHLFFSDEDYARLGTRIKCNPAVKTAYDRSELRKALSSGAISTVGTDHAPHLLKDKEGGCARAASGMPMIQFSLVTMLELVDNGVLDMERLVRLMCHNPADIFEVRGRGYLRKGYKADIVLVGRDRRWTVTGDTVRSKCGWSPMEGHAYDWRVVKTICNGQVVYDDGTFYDNIRGEQVMFR
ncbi:dihydroorotase [Leyella lascolaii]|uniref:Dihydroorotase n=1 Tax=Leyella lascolaii TaxID=1776379 RepID=A0AAW7JGM5_9BACT|nr:dihydroorotase [Leyella lascolaii]MDN0021945.1 dihydroorotase [Leyella lascolaii]MDN0024662.1 dihydroorotase [Leyella lascolaii]